MRISSGHGLGNPSDGVLAGRVDPHLRPDVRYRVRDRQLIDRPLDELEVVPGVRLQPDPVEHLREVVDVDVRVHDDDVAGEHQLPEAPEGVHHLAGVTGEPLADRDHPRR